MARRAHDTLAAMGENDVWIPISDGHELARRMTDAPVTPVPNAKHLGSGGSTRSVRGGDAAILGNRQSRSSVGWPQIFPMR